MININPSFAPNWLARVTLEDKQCMSIVENFLHEIPRDLFGGIVLKNMTTHAEYKAADRYMPTITFLASLWTIPNENFCLLGQKTGELPVTLIDTSMLRSVKPSQLFVRASQIGEQGYAEEHERRVQELILGEQNREPCGSWQLVWVPDEY